MKRLFLIIILLVFTFTGCNLQDKSPNLDLEPTKIQNEQIKSIWISYFEFSDFTLNNDENTFRTKVDNCIKELKSMGFNTITLQVRPCADAFYNSSYFPTSKYCFGKEGGELVYDPLAIFCELANKENIKIEAWINPYRVSQNTEIDSLSDNNIAKKWYYDKNNNHNLFISDKAIYFNPASKDVINLIVNGVKEIVQNYNIYSIHFDDYFYPTTDESIDNIEYQEYLDNGGKMSLFNWRRENVNTLIKDVYKAIKSTNKEVLFGISPSANVEMNYNKLYADVKLWASNDGYLDYICPQVYYGFLNESRPFIDTVKEWSRFTTKPLYIGLPLYKCGVVDNYASKEDIKSKNEFIDNSNIISRQINFINKIDNISGYYIFSYSSLFNNDKKNEVDEIIKIMQSNSRL